MDHAAPQNLPPSAEPPFPVGGGELGAQIRHHDWSQSALGPPHAWSQELRIATQNMLHCAFPQMILWGRGPWVLYNDAFLPILGADHHGALGARFGDLWPKLWQDLKPVLREVRATMHPRQARTFPAEFAGQKRLGGRGYAFSLNPLFLRSGQVGGIAIIAAQTADDALRRSDARFRAVLEASRDIIAITKPDTRFLFLSPSAQRLLKRPLTELLGAPLLDLLPDKEAPKIRALFADLATRPGQDEEFIIPIDCPSGKTCWFAATACNLLEEEGLEGILLNMRNITKLKRYEAQLLDAKERAEEMARLKTILLANMSHEFRTPLTSMIGMASLLAEQVQPPLRAHAQEIERAGRRLSQTLSSVLTLAQIEGKAIQVQVQDLELKKELSQIADALQPDADQEGLDLILELPAENVWARHDPAYLQGVLTHIIQNAIKFTEEGRITLRLIPTQEEAIIEVQDTGPGIREEFLPTLFEEFHQESTGLARSHEGIGLGLAIARHMLEAMEGSIEARSTPGEGSTFIIHLPRLTEPPSTPPTSARSSTPAAATRPLRPRLLVVEDEDAIRAIIEHLLHNDFDVTAVSNAESALKKAAKRPFDLILLDIGLPGMSGVDALHQLRALQTYAQRPIVALSGYAMPDDRRRFLDEGFSEYIEKPFAPHELKDKLMDLL